MDPKFREAVESLHPQLERLRASAPHSGRASQLPKQGVYLFSEHGKHLYVGRSNNIPRRFADHRVNSPKLNKAAFARLIACRELGIVADYRAGANTHKNLPNNPKFAEAFRKTKERIRAMEFRAVEEADQTRQALLEIYCAVALNACYNDFRTH
jgi:predicted GIY-YIG superfamily endonuclease